MFRPKLVMGYTCFECGGDDTVMFEQHHGNEDGICTGTSRVVWCSCGAVVRCDTTSESTDYATITDFKTPHSEFVGEGKGYHWRLGD